MCRGCVGLTVGRRLNAFGPFMAERSFTFPSMCVNEERGQTWWVLLPY
jgi:hypothetical protein